MAGLFCWVLERVVRSFPERLRRGRARRFAPSRPGSGAPRPLAREPSSLSLRSCAGSFAPGSDSGTLSPGARGRHQASGIRRPVLSSSTASLHGGAFLLGVGARCPEFPRAPSPGPRASLRSFASRFRRAPPACPRTIQLVASLLRRIVRPGSDSGTLSPGARGRHQASGIRRPVLSNSTASLHGGAFYWVWGRVVLSFPERLRRAARVASLFASRFRRAPPACPRTIQLVASLLRRIVRPGSDSGTLSPAAEGGRLASGVRIRRPVFSSSTASLHGGAFYWMWGRVVRSFPERLRRAARVASLLCVPAQARPARLPTNDPACRFAPAPDRSPRIVRPRPAAELTVNPDDRGV